MKVTAILRNLSPAFWEGSEYLGPGFLTQGPDDQWAQVQRLRADGMASIKIATGQLRDQVELNQILRAPHTKACTIEPRRGYKLVTFTIEKI